MEQSGDPSPRPLRFGRIAAVVNVASGGVDAHAGERLKALLLAHGHEVEPKIASGPDVEALLQEALAERPDLLIVLAGDGTLARSAQLCGEQGVLLAALPGGTMNMLPFALHGRQAWHEALDSVLGDGRVVEVSGGAVAGHTFYVAAILGSPALFADAREAMRRGKLRLAVLRTRRAVLRAFKGRLRFTLDGGRRRKGEALSLMCPLVSRAMDADIGLEAATLNPRGAMDVFRLGVGVLTGSWRSDPAVRCDVVQEVEAWARGRIPAILDGEPHRLDPPVRVSFRRAAFRALVPADSPALALSKPPQHDIEPLAPETPALATV